MTELTDNATAFALADAADAASRKDRRKWDNRQEPDYFEMARTLRELGFVIVKKEQDG